MSTPTRPQRARPPARKKGVAISGRIPLSVARTLASRGSRYGLFETNARISQGLKSVMLCSPKWRSLAPDQREALELVAMKISRILAGDPDYVDNWHDAAGYFTIIDERLNGLRPRDAVVTETKLKK